MQGDELRVDMFAMPGGHSRYLYGQVLAAAPIGRNGMRFTASASRGDQYLRSDEHFEGQSTNISAQLSYPLIRSRSFTVVGKAALTDWRSVGSQDHVRHLRDRLRVARLGVDFGTEGKNRIQGELYLSQGLGFGGMTKVGDPLASRPDASGRFTKAALTLQASRPFGDRLTLRTIVMAQYSNRPLLSAEEFSLGGNRIGRAFAFNYRTGDRGAGGGLEVSYRLGNPQKDRTGLELFGFGDGGVARDMKSSVAPARSYSLASAGIGTRLTLAGTTISLEAGVPVAGRHDHSPRLFVSAFRAF
jgi:hemolysin activation/secretion protein